MSKKFAKRFLTRNADKILYNKRHGIENAFMRTEWLARMTLYGNPILFRQFKL